MEDPKKDLQMTEALKKVRKTGSRVTITLSAVAGGLAVALLLVCIGSGLYITRLQQTIGQKEESIDKDDDTKGGQCNMYNCNIKHGDKTERDEVCVDQSRDTEKFVRRDENGDISSIAVADFKKGIYAMYIPESDECYIISGADSWMANTSEANLIYGENNGKTFEVDDTEPRTNYEKASETPIKDHSILPHDLREWCEGKPVYWMKTTCEEEDKPEDGVLSRKKRNHCICWYCRLVWHRIRRRWVWLCYYWRCHTC